MDSGSVSLFLSLMFSALGAGLFIYGKRQSRLPQMLAGLLLSLYPHFVSNPWVMAGIAVVLLLAVWAAVKAGF